MSSCFLKILAVSTICQPQTIVFRAIVMVALSQWSLNYIWTDLSVSAPNVNNEMKQSCVNMKIYGYLYKFVRED